MMYDESDAWDDDYQPRITQSQWDAIDTLKREMLAAGKRDECKVTTGEGCVVVSFWNGETWGGETYCVDEEGAIEKTK